MSKILTAVWTKPASCIRAGDMVDFTGNGEDMFVPVTAFREYWTLSGPVMPYVDIGIAPGFVRKNYWSVPLHRQFPVCADFLTGAMSAGSLERGDAIVYHSRLLTIAGVRRVTREGFRPTVQLHVPALDPVKNVLWFDINEPLNRVTGGRPGGQL